MQTPWRNRVADLPTPRAWVESAGSADTAVSQAARLKIINRYQEACEGYLAHLFCRETFGADPPVEARRAQDVFHVIARPRLNEWLQEPMDLSRDSFTVQLLEQLAYVHFIYTSGDTGVGGHAPPTPIDQAAWDSQFIRHHVYTDARDNLRKDDRWSWRFIELHGEAEQLDDSSLESLRVRLGHEFPDRPVAPNSMSQLAKRARNKFGWELVKSVRKDYLLLPVGERDPDRELAALQAMSLHGFVDGSSELLEYFGLDSQTR